MNQKHEFMINEPYHKRWRMGGPLGRGYIFNSVLYGDKIRMSVHRESDFSCVENKIVTIGNDLKWKEQCAGWQLEMEKHYA